mgnify:CR=1 FL=1
MALLFSNVAEQYVNKSKTMVEDEEEKKVLSTKVSALFAELDEDDDDFEEDTITQSVLQTVGEERVLPQKMFMTSVANQYYQKSIEDINNTKIGNKAVRRKNFQQVMKESFFYGANRFGNNFIA